VAALCHQENTIIGRDTHTDLSKAISNVDIETGNEAQLSQAWHRVPVLDSPKLPRLLTEYNRNQSLNLLVTVRRLFEDYGIEYMMAYGTLLGSYVAHSILAWDDDLDWVIHARHQPLLMELAANKSIKVGAWGYKGVGPENKRSGVMR
jgi:hypothetical protein